MSVTPYKINVPEDKITRLKQKLAAAELPDELEDAGWDMGSPLADVKRLAKYWRDEFDWRQAEAELNQMPQFTTTMQIEGFDPIELHFVHAKSSRPNAVPLLFCHGWPGSFEEVSKLLPLLVDGGGSDDKPAFDVVAPSLPGFGFSSGVKKRGFSVMEMAEVLGYDQYTFLALRTLANRHQQTLTCIAVSHSSEAATKKWLDLLGGAWNVQIVVDEDRSVYAAWGLGLGNTWYLFNPTTQIQGWKEKGWLGATVATSIQRTNTLEDRVKATAPPPKKPGMMRRATGEQQRQDELPTVEMEEEGPSTVLGNKWQQAGAWAIDGRGTVVWGGKALRADDLMDLDQGAKILGL
ncbi:hypothetical protein ACKVV7_010505 [Pyricularia oryzae]